ncbi:hypothetical protein [Nocardiopsis lucentensis]|uniref:hypothetical protein n=1 Tax=Nocardiopsis lucentensis TaxID=53441 RepID=UPI000345399F|nr:hypothetical protein [Nocardiopsis lucentensis]
MSAASPDLEPGSGTGAETPRRPLAAVRIGLVSGLVGIMCCVGPTVLALLGVVSAGTAFVWATDLYDGYAWWFRLGGLAVLVALVWWSLYRKRMCSLDGARKAKGRIALALGVAVATYGVLYGVTTWLGTLA